MDRFRHRTPLARAAGLGSARSGFSHWWTERITAVALVPLTLWFAGSLIARSRSDHEAFLSWLATPVSSVLMILLLIALFWHMALGLQVIIEDYVHSGAKYWALLAVRFICSTLAAIGILAMLRITLTAWASA